MAKVASHGVFQGESPLDHALPLVILQICLVLVVTRGLAYLLRPLRQPRVIAEIVGGILLGPSALGRNTKYLNAIFPPDGGTIVLDTLANLGLLFFVFLVGLELDISALRRTGRKALAISLCGIALPFALGVGTSFAFRGSGIIGDEVGHAPLLVFMGVALSITAFSVLARILTELKLLTTDLGRTALSASAVDDVTAWVLLALAVALSGSGSPVVALWALLSAAGFVGAAFLLLRPVLDRMARRCRDGEPVVGEAHVCATLAAVLAAGFLTDLIGIHALFGGFVVGVVVPKEGPFARMLSEKVEDLVSGLLVPLYFVSSGLKTDIATISGAKSWALLVLVIANACVGKIGGAVAAAVLVKIPAREAVALGFLMNTKGLVELVVLNIGRDRGILNDEAFAIMVLTALVTTFITTPAVMAIYKPARPTAPHKRRTVGDRGGGELRVLACFHSSRSIPTLLNLVEATRGSRSRLVMYAMHLVELSERSSAISMIQRARRNGVPFFNSTSSGSDQGQMVVAFEAFRQLSSVRVRPMTVISDLDTIHRDVIDSAADKRAAIVVMPYHKILQQDGSFLSLGSTYHAINKRVLREAPCSVAVLVDRGLGGPAQVAAKNVAFTVAVLFFGGPDDREALAYATRMGEHPGVAVTLVRFQPHWPQSGEEKRLDEAAVEAFKAKIIGAIKDGSVRFEEHKASTKEEVVATIDSMSHFSAFVVGRMPPAEALVEGADELGPVGSYLVSPAFRTSASVLVVKRYDPATNPKSKRFDPKARPPVATEEDEETSGSATVVPVTSSPITPITDIA